MVRSPFLELFNCARNLSALNSRSSSSRLASDVVGLGESHLPSPVRRSTGATSQSLPVAVIVGHFLIPSRKTTNFLVVANPS